MPTINVSGLASGLDVEGLIAKLIEVERIPIELATKRKAELQTKQDAWRDLRTRLNNLLTELSNLRLSTTYTAKVATSSNENAVTAAAASNAAPATYLFNVTILAQAHEVASDFPTVTLLGDTFKDTSKVNLGATTAKVDTAQGWVTLPDSYTPGENYFLQSINVNLDSPVTKIKFYASDDQPEGTSITYYYSPDGGANFYVITPGEEVSFVSEVTQLLLKASLSSSSESVQPKIYDYCFEGSFSGITTSSALNKSGTFQVKGLVEGERVTREITVEATDSLQGIRDKLNVANAGVTAKILDNRLVIESNTRGSAGYIEFVDDAETKVLASLGVLDYTSGEIKNELRAAQDASFSFNGLTVTRSTNTITDLVSGVTFYLQGPGEATVSIGNDLEKPLEAITSFVAQYNSVMDFMATKGGKDAQDKPAELFGDPTLIRLQQTLKRLATDQVLGATPYSSLSALGITTADPSAKLGFDQAGKLTVDEAKLRETLAENLEAVRELFCGTNGVAVRLNTYVQALALTGGVVPGRENQLANTIRDLEKQISRLEERLSRREEQLWYQFTALEKVLSTLKQQSDWLAAQILTLPGFNQSK